MQVHAPQQFAPLSRRTPEPREVAAVAVIESLQKWFGVRHMFLEKKGDACVESHGD